MSNNPETPMLRQYHEIKQKHIGALLFFRMGDFYELFYDDAVTAARELEITLTARNKERGNAVPMCGVPHHAATGYIAKLVKKGYRVAICDQTTKPSKDVKLVKREVVRVITPGTAIDEQLLETRDSVFLCAIYGAGDKFGAAFLELSTGEFRATERTGNDAWEKIVADIESFAPREILFPESQKLILEQTFSANEQSSLLTKTLSDASNSNVVPISKFQTSTNFPTTLTPLEDWIFNRDYAENQLKQQFGVKELAGYGIAEKTCAISAAGACLRYAQETQRATASHIAEISYFEPHDSMILDAITLRNLEICESSSEGGKMRSLFGVIDSTVTASGSRLLKSWLLRPSIKRNEIETRLSAVDELTDSFLRDKLRTLLKEVSDLERIIGRLNLNTATPRDLLSLARSLSQVPRIKQTLSDANSSLLQVLRENVFELPEILSLIRRSIADEPPINFADGGIIRAGFNVELDELRAISHDAKSIIASIEEREKTRTNIATLKVKFNSVFGYFIEISKGQAARVPPDYERRQTLTNAERYTTPELKEWERKVLGAEERIIEIEIELFQQIRAEVSAETRNLQTTARALATLDALAALAETARKRDFVRPVLHDGDELEIKDGRHPVIEAFLSEPYIPNDVFMNNSTDRLLIITGPNMGGKCLRGDSLIFTDAGLIYLEDLKPKNSEVGKFSDISHKVKARDGIRKATHFYNDGNQKTIRLKTRFGYEIEGTVQHQLWVRHANGEEKWTKFSELKIGDVIAIDRKINLFGNQIKIDNKPISIGKTGKIYNLPTNLNENLGYLLGLLVGDGTTTFRQGFILTTADDFMRDEFTRIMREEFNCRVGKTGISYRVNSVQIRLFLEKLGLGFCRAPEKYIPASVRRAPKKIIRAFLQGLFDTDGWAANSQVKVFFASASKKLAHEVHLLLLNFGIVSSLHKKKTAKLPSYQVAIYGVDAIKFHKEIGFRLPRKQIRAELASSLRMPNLGIPNLALTLKTVQTNIVATPNKKVALKKNKEINSIFYTYLPNQRNISYSKLTDLIDYCHENGVNCDDLEILQKQNYFYDAITSIEESEGEVFDLTVTGNPSYIANGFVSHNSSTLRQVAVTQILAQIGSFVPARTAKLPLVDRVWTRVGASDDLARGRSTFMVEMTETAQILHNATPRSLVLLDEIGRGTSTFDGLSIAWSVVEYLHDSPEHAAKTLFATHYHELTELAERLSGAQNYQITATERNGEVVFLHKLERGKAEQSYGIAVAKLAGLPTEAINRAKEVLQKLERYEIDVFAEDAKLNAAAAPQTPANDDRDAALQIASKRSGRGKMAAQFTLFQTANESLLEEIQFLDISELSAEELREFIVNLQKRMV